MITLRCVLIASIAATTIVTSTIAVAGPRERNWHGDMRRFHNDDYPRWRTGRWYHGNHGGRIGWWWIAADMWYLYPTPIYPYPNPYIPPAIVTEPEPQRESVWYYCESSRTYYPYVSACPEGWRMVPAQPRDNNER